MIYCYNCYTCGKAINTPTAGDTACGNCGTVHRVEWQAEYAGPKPRLPQEINRLPAPPGDKSVTTPEQGKKK